MFAAWRRQRDISIEIVGRGKKHAPILCARNAGRKEGRRRRTGTRKRERETKNMGETRKLRKTYEMNERRG